MEPSSSLSYGSSTWQLGRSESAAVAWEEPLISGNKTVSSEELSDGELWNLALAAGFSHDQAESIRWAFHLYADLAENGLSGSRRLSFPAFSKLLEDLGLELSKGYKKQFFHAFDIEDRKKLSLRNFFLGLIVSDPSTSAAAGDQWLRCRLELLFRFYDTDKDGRWSQFEFMTFIRHMMRLDSVEDESLQVSVTNVSKALWGNDETRQFVGMREVVNAIHRGAFRAQPYNLHTSMLFRLPSLRDQLVGKVLSMDGTVVRTALQVKPLHDVVHASKSGKSGNGAKGRAVSFAMGANTVVLETEGEHCLNAVATSGRPGHVHKKNLG